MLFLFAVNVVEIILRLRELKMGHVRSDVPIGWPKVVSCIYTESLYTFGINRDMNYQLCLFNARILCYFCTNCFNFNLVLQKKRGLTRKI